jgi:hypothetical protein
MYRGSDPTTSSTLNVPTPLRIDCEIMPFWNKQKPNTSERRRLQPLPTNSCIDFAEDKTPLPNRPDCLNEKSATEKAKDLQWA